MSSASQPRTAFRAAESKGIARRRVGHKKPSEETQYRAGRVRPWAERIETERRRPARSLGRQGRQPDEDGWPTAARRRREAPELAAAPRIIQEGRGQGGDVHRERIAAAAMRAAEGCDVLLICLPMGFQEALAVALEQDCRVVAAATVSEGVVWATSTEPALAIVDTMAERDAIGMIQILRRRTEGCVIAAFGAKDLGAEGLAFGLLAADITFTTPMSTPEILDRIRALLLVTENRKVHLSRLSPYVARAIGLIGDRYGEQLSLKTVADAVGVSPAHLSRLFKQETGKVFRVFFTRVRVELAKRLIRTDGTKLKAIGRRVGFNDASHLSRHFQKYEGCRPGAYRARVQQG